MKKHISTLIFLFLAAPSSGAQGIIGSNLPNEILGRTDRSAAEIASLNAELDQRRLFLVGLLILIPATFIAKKCARKCG